MFIISYTPHITTPYEAKTFGSLVTEGKRTTIKFAVLEDALIAAGAVKKACCHDVYVSSEEDTESRYMIPRKYW